MVGYSALIREASRELTAKERVAFKDTTNCVSFDEATANDHVIIDVDMYVILDIHNEHSDDKDYTKYVIVSKDGTRYVTGSESFFTSFMDIFSEMCGVDEEWKLDVYKMESKNYKGKGFITCSII